LDEYTKIAVQMAEKSGWLQEHYAALVLWYSP
jgi:GTP-dependent phosphoenolpyruvate carboxykinase